MDFLFDPCAFDGGPRPDAKEFRQRGQVDAAIDAEWFEGHPGETHRIRDPSPREIFDLCLPPSAKIAAVRLSDGTQMRVVVCGPLALRLPGQLRVD